MPLKLKKRGAMWYAVGKIKGQLHRISTEFPVGTRQNREAAARVCSELDHDIRTTAKGHTKAPTFAQWWATYRDTYEGQKAALTQKHDEGIMRLHALPFFGKTKLDQIKRSDCQRYLNLRRRDVQMNPKREAPRVIAEGTVRRERGLLQAVLQKAVDDEILDRNPWLGIAKGSDTVRDRVVSDVEQTKLLAQLSRTYQRFVLFLLGTGFRLDECRGIVVDRDVDFKTRRVTVTGKFRKVRTIRISEDLAQLLRTQLSECGTLWTQNPQRLREVLDHAAERAGIPHVTPHTLRHTFGHRWLKDRGDIHKLSKVLGHASISVTEKHYAHVLQEDLDRAVDERDLGIAVSLRAVVDAETPKAARTTNNVTRGEFGANARG